MVFTDIVEYNGKHYYIDSCWTSDHGYDTMAFLCDSDGNVLSWEDLYCERYATAAQMEIGHKKAIKNIKEGRFYND